MRRQAAYVTGLLICMALIAGCAGGLGGGEAPDWVTDDGETVNATALAEAHGTELSAANSYTTEVERLAVFSPDDPEPDTWRPNQSVRANIDFETEQRLTVRQGPQNSSLYVDGETRFSVVEMSGESMYGTGEASWEEWSPSSYSRTVLFGLADWNLTYRGTVERDGETLHRVTGVPPADFDISVSELSTIESASVELLVTDDGLVRQYERRVNGTAEATPRPGETETVRVTYIDRRRWESIGETTVEEPEWVSNARNAS